MAKLKKYYDYEINRLCEAVIKSDEKLVDKLLADKNFTEINDGVSPLTFIGYNMTDFSGANGEKVLRIFRKILNNERFTNVNTVFYDGYYSSTLLSKLLYYSKRDPLFEQLSIELINSPKFQLIDYPGNYNDSPNILNEAVLCDAKEAAHAIMDHKDFTKIDFAFGGSDFVEECKKYYFKYIESTPEGKEKLLKPEEFSAITLILNEYFFRENNGKKNYNATNTNISRRLTNAIKFLLPRFNVRHGFTPVIAAGNYNRKDNSLIIDIVNHPKYTNRMLRRDIIHICMDLNNKESYALFKNNPKLEGNPREFYDELMYFAINEGKRGLFKALIENKNIQLSETFYSFYNYFLKQAIHESTRYNYVLDITQYSKKEANEVCDAIDRKQTYQFKNKQLSLDNYITLSDADYKLLCSGMSRFYYLIFGSSENDLPENHEELKNKLVFDKETCETGPFFNSFDRDIVWKFFSRYDSFDKYRKMVTSKQQK